MLHGGECKPYREQCNKQALLQPWRKLSSLMYGMVQLPMFLQTANNIEGMCVMQAGAAFARCAAMTSAMPLPLRHALRF